ncbi:glycosyl hydrolase family 18 protein [Mediterraneibacter sp. ICN-202921]|jgi:spore germination protein YaaH|uniref:glycosyl hydrolase family 18 protein n=1 Tax=Mediterraneibacter sp. ICN-202921 TaxID=3134657 RepID=UPI0030BAA63C
MDERERRGVQTRRARQQEIQRRRPSSSARRTGGRPEADRAAGNPNMQRTRRRSSRARRRRRNLIIRTFLFIIVLIALIVGVIFWKKYGSSNEKADLNQYYGLVNEDDMAVIVNNQVIRSTDDAEAVSPGKMFDGIPYVEYSVVRDNINKRIYWDSNENVLLYTLPNGNVAVEVGKKEYTEINETKTEEYVILKTEGKTAYIALPFIEKYTNMVYSVYKKPGRAVITSEWGKVQTAKLKRDTEVRYQGGVKSPILTEVEKADKVTVLEDEDNWKKVATADGFVGYVKTSSLKDEKTETLSNDFEEPVYTNISEDHTINMAWHNVENEDANNYVLETIAGTKGLTTIAPTWFNLADTEGNISSIANSNYVNYAHQSKLEVWAVLRDFHGGINSYDETYQVLSYTSKRTNVINQVIAAALQSGVDGINLDFELISSECGEHYIQFVRELSVKCRQNGLVFSVDNYVPQPYNAHYDLEEQGIMADYVILMAYDEHTEGSYEAGSVSSYDYVKTGIEDALKMVPNTKLIAGIPFYTRLWLETPKTEQELAEEEGTEAADYPNKVTSSALGMDEAVDTLQSVGAQAEWDDTAKQNYASWETDEGTYKIWLEDSASIEEKLKLIKQNKLAGVAEWKLGWENASVWDLILQYVN